MTFLNGNKTYIGMIILGAVGLSYSMGWLDEKTFTTIGSIVGAWTGIMDGTG